ncbi:MAG: formate/nitrite transporter family protein [Candidatus Eremiobacteraeota bacterium]|nr:formate/nitrite transporter family protein [Candidatus Eremiobacteraeota bacterium]
MQESLKEPLLPDQIVVGGGEPGTYVGTPVLDYVKPHQLVETMLESGAAKGELAPGKILVRGMLGGAFLAYGTAMAAFGTAQGMIPILSALLFPTGFIIINILQLDLATGYFCYVPLALAEGRTTFAKMTYAISTVYVANLLGSLVVAFLLWAALTTFGQTPDTTIPTDPVTHAPIPGGKGISTVLSAIAISKTNHYVPFGIYGQLTAFVKGILCNWFVTLGVILPMTTRSAFGKALLTFVPIYMFFCMGWEHLIVNMFVIPSAMLYGAPITAGTWWLWNELPVTIGNFFGGYFFTALAIGWIYRTRRLSTLTA